MDGVDKIIDSIKRVVKSELGSYDSTAQVRRIEGDTAWVHIPGGVDETPVRLTMNAKEGDNVQVRVSDGKAFLAGNVSAPPTDDTRANQAYTVAKVAEDAAENALSNAERAREAADNAVDSARIAEGAANNAQDAADTAQQAADTALVNLATTENVVGVLNWITAHGTMTLTSDVTVNPAHVYFVVDVNGDYVVGGTHYSVVAEPTDDDIATYYELTVDESVQNYVATHIVVDTEGLWIVPDSGGNKVLIATGAGSTYTTAGTYIVGSGNVVLAAFTANGTQVGQTGESRLVTNAYSMKMIDRNGTEYFTAQDLRDENGLLDMDLSWTGDGSTYMFDFELSASDTNYTVLKNGSDVSSQVTRYTSFFSFGYQSPPAVGDIIECHYTTSDFRAKMYTVGFRKSLLPKYGPMSIVAGFDCAAEKIYDYAEGYGSKASGYAAHAEGQVTRALAEASHAQNWGTIAAKEGQTALGTHNIEDTAQTTTHPSQKASYGQYAVIIGNGTADNARSNALTVDWSGNVVASGDVTDGNSNVLSNKADKSSVKNISVVSKSGSTGSISSGSYKNLSLTPTAPAGKSLVGCVGVHMEGTNSSYCQLIGYYVNGSDVHVQMKNTSSGSVTWTCTVDALYV